MPTNVKGTALVSTARYLAETFGQLALNRIVAELSPEERQSMEGLLASAWYPLPLLVKVMRLARAQLGAQAPDIVRDIGRASADYGLKGIYKIFFKVGTPSFIISKAPTVMKTYYSTGRAYTTVNEEKHAGMEMVDLEDPAPEVCERLEGWMQRTIQLSGGKSVRVVHAKCVNRGDPVCRWEGWWE